uniref:DNA-binding protein, H-NS family n=1 Tax=uncultured Thiotrichaceae bacterium TaxID=298394 RepID=A0A6S6SJ14_9GAMM|nr:MAG: DNA-binding protein, H-NS family [uncultured Thiotrichaceae bacterium]
MSNIDLDNLSISELDNLKNTINSTIENKRQTELLDVRQQLEELIDASPFSLQEVLDAKAMRKPVKPKYRNPDDVNQTWTGRGRRPRWVDECLNSGITLEDLTI